ncbi:MAG: glyceraldehyde 3-phosphate dehydrogenase, partial [Porticoccus sp.]
MVRIAINGYGRIGRNILRAFYERPELKDKIEIVAVNDRGDVSINAHLTQYDSVHGHFNHLVQYDEQSLIIADDHIRVLSEANPSKLPWAELKIDVVLECTGAFTDRDKAAGHLEAGAQKVLVSAPGKNMDATVVFGINDQELTSEHRIISNASCTTNCLAPI